MAVFVAARDREPGVPADRPLLSCRQVWKIFGAGGAKFMADHQNTPSDAQLRLAGLIGAVRDVTLDVQQGEIFVIMGLSGSGKSTLVRCMSRLLDPSFGEIIFQGQDLAKASEREMIELRRHKMGMVFQHFALLPHLTVLGNVAFPLEVQRVPRAQSDARARELIELVGLGGREDYFPRELSGGQQQRVGIARSLAVEPDIWFLDEPFSALDPLIRREMQDEFLRLQNLLHKTIVFITHDFDEAIRLADRIAIMNDGAIVQIGTPEEVIITPASDYVGEFTRDVPRARVLSAGAVMTPSSGPHERVVRATSKIAEIAEMAVASPEPIGVTDEAGDIVGELSRDRVVEVLLNRSARP